MNEKFVKAEAEVKFISNIICLQYHDYSEYLLEFSTTEEDSHTLQIQIKKIFVIPRVDSFNIYINVLHVKSISNKK